MKHTKPTDGRPSAFSAPSPMPVRRVGDFGHFKSGADLAHAPELFDHARAEEGTNDLQIDDQILRANRNVTIVERAVDRFHVRPAELGILAGAAQTHRD